MVVELDINNSYVLVRFSKDEVSAILQKAVDEERTIKDVIYELVRIGYNQVVIQE